MTEQQTSDAQANEKHPVIGASTVVRRGYPVSLVSIIIACVVLIAGISTYLWYRSINNHSASVNAAEQKSLQAELANPLSPNFNQTISAATQLINGRLSGKYHFSNALLAQYYMQAGSAMVNLKEYSSAMAYFKAAPKYDNSVQMAALQGEVNSGYALGERQQLIPMLEQLENLSKGLHDPVAPSSAQYQADIQAIEHNQEVNL